jgi:steroid 5-alpha reductase family enzyme
MINQLLILAATGMIAVAVVMTMVWLWATKIKNAGIVDIFWSYNFPVLAVIYFLLAEGYDTRKLIILIMVCIWGLRLGTYLLVRIFGHITEEDGRYQQLRKEWAPNINSRFFWFFQMQAFSNVLLSLPFILICMNANTTIHFLEIVGALLWLISITGESIADRQLQVFKKNSSNKGKVCDVGLWRYSRHPNYFFEWMIWVSYFIFACASPYGWISVFCPIAMLYLLFKVTGIPMTEEQALRSKGQAYKNYQQTTSVFVPWFRNKYGEMKARN